jgi:hypothetical protein
MCIKRAASTASRGRESVTALISVEVFFHASSRGKGNKGGDSGECVHDFEWGRTSAEDSTTPQPTNNKKYDKNRNMIAIRAVLRTFHIPSLV